MGDQLLLAEGALKVHRAFLQEVLAEVMPMLSTGTPGDERLIESLEVYWEACFARRETRRAVLAATRGSCVEKVVEPMGKPFQVMVRAELLPRHGADADALAQTVYDIARAIAVDEAVADARAPARRRALIKLIRSEMPASRLTA